MPNPTPHTQKLQAIQTICLAMLGGVLLFAGVVIAIGPTGEPGEAHSLIQIGVVALPVLVLCTGFVLLRVLDGQTGKKLAARRAEALAEVERGDAPPEYAQRTIIAVALGEAAALMGPVAYLVSGVTLAAVPVVLGVAWMAAHFPSRDRARAAVEQAGRANH